MPSRINGINNSSGNSSGNNAVGNSSGSSDETPKNINDSGNNSNNNNNDDTIDTIDTIDSINSRKNLKNMKVNVSGMHNDEFQSPTPIGTMDDFVHIQSPSTDNEEVFSNRGISVTNVHRGGGFNVGGSYFNYSVSPMSTPYRNSDAGSEYKSPNINQNNSNNNENNDKNNIKPKLSNSRSVPQKHVMMMNQRLKHGILNQHVASQPNDDRFDTSYNLNTNVNAVASETSSMTTTMTSTVTTTVTTHTHQMGGYNPRFRSYTQTAADRRRKNETVNRTNHENANNDHNITNNGNRNSNDDSRNGLSGGNNSNTMVRQLSSQSQGSTPVDNNRNRNWTTFEPFRSVPTALMTHTSQSNHINSINVNASNNNSNNNNNNNTNNKRIMYQSVQSFQSSFESMHETTDLNDIDAIHTTNVALYNRHSSKTNPADGKHVRFITKTAQTDGNHQISQLAMTNHESLLNFGGINNINRDINIINMNSSLNNIDDIRRKQKANVTVIHNEMNKSESSISEYYEKPRHIGIGDPSNSPVDETPFGKASRYQQQSRKVE